MGKMKDLAIRIEEAAMKKEKRHSFTIKGFIERGRPAISWSVSFVEGDSIDEAIKEVREIFAEPIEVTDVDRIISRERDND